MFYEQYCRFYQGIMRKTLPYLPWREPRLLIGENCLEELAQIIVQSSYTTILLVTDKGIQEAGLCNSLIEQLNTLHIKTIIYDQTVPNPTIENIEQALQLYKSHHCDAILAFGGGSPIDCAKAVAARVANPRKSIEKMRGLLKVRKNIPPLIAVPTTSGTGSEATLAAVISNEATKEKYALMDPALMPHIVVLDPLLTINLPSTITAATGMDALTHAIEAFIGHSTTPDTERWSKEAVKIIFETILITYENPSNLIARKKMQIAAYLAGKAFTRAYVGNVHAIAHTLSAYYNVPHGIANAVLLPVVLEYYGDATHKRLAMLADTAQLCDAHASDEVKAKKFIQKIQYLNDNMNMPNRIDSIQTNDLEKMAQQATEEANPLYPVPVIFNTKDMKEILKRVQ